MKNKYYTYIWIMIMVTAFILLTASGCTRSADGSGGYTIIIHNHRMDPARTYKRSDFHIISNGWLIVTDNKGNKVWYSPSCNISIEE